jgi:YVTN family beta-propeller protein
MMRVDCRGERGGGPALMAAYNSLVPGERLHATMDGLNAGLKVWLLEAGIRYAATPADSGSVELDIERGATPAQGTIPGVHHVAAAGDSVWVCERAHRVARIDIATGRVAAITTAAAKASHLVLDAHANRVFVADPGAGAVLAFRASDLLLMDRWDAPGMPQLPAASPEGIVCVTGAATGTVTIATPHHGRYNAITVAVGAAPHDPLMAVDGRHVYVPCMGGAEVAKVRLSDGGIEGRVQVGAGPSHLARAPDGRHIYSANSWDGTLSRFSADGGDVTTVHSGGWAHAIEVTPDGRSVWVANFLDDTLTVFDAETLARVALLDTGRYPHGLDISPDGRYVVATAYSSRDITIYDAAARVATARVEVGMGSSHTAFTGDGSVAYIPCSVDDHVACVDVAAGRVNARLQLEEGAPL